MQKSFLLVNDILRNSFTISAISIMAKGKHQQHRNNLLVTFEVSQVPNTQLNNLVEILQTATTARPMSEQERGQRLEQRLRQQDRAAILAEIWTIMVAVIQITIEVSLGTHKCKQTTGVATKEGEEEEAKTADKHGDVVSIFFICLYLIK